MPTLVSKAPYRPAPTEPRRVRWTRAEYEALEKSGVFEGRNYELIEGELVDKMGKNLPHGLTAASLLIWFWQVFGHGRVSSEISIDVSPEDNPTSKPEPDVVVFNKPGSRIATLNPRPEDICLVAEISDTTLGFDLTTKAALYARAGIPEYWVLDVAQQRLIVHRDPVAGAYTSIVAYNADEDIAPLAAPDARFRVADAFREE